MRPTTMVRHATAATTTTPAPRARSMPSWSTSRPTAFSWTTLGPTTNSTVNPAVAVVTHYVGNLLDKIPRKSDN